MSEEKQDEQATILVGALTREEFLGERWYMSRFRDPEDDDISFPQPMRSIAEASSKDET
jgi:hypothetical protein